MFVERLTGLLSRVEGAHIASLVAADGIPVETERIADAPALDVDSVAAELMSQVRSITHNHQELEVGDVRHLSLTTERMTLMVTTVTEDYFLLLALSPDANTGRARFELRRAVLDFEKDLI